MRMRCDFCSSADVRWEYPAADFVVFDLPVRQGSKDGWAACEECHLLIEADDRTGLADRSLAAFGDFQVGLGLGSPDLLATFRSIYQGFWNHRTGPGRLMKKGCAAADPSD